MDPVEERLQQLRHRPVEVTRDLATVDPSPVWERGKRWQRRRRVGSLLGAGLALVLAAGAALAGWHSLPSVDSIQPARSVPAVGFPKTVYQPTKPLPDYSRQRAVMADVPWKNEDKTYGDPYAISAETGAYGALDLPDLASPDISLSRNGQYLAYWISGATTGKPYGAESGFETVAGIAVVNLLTGRRETAALNTPHGVAPQRLTWTRTGKLTTFTYQNELLDRNGPDNLDNLLTTAGDSSYSVTWTPTAGFTVKDLGETPWMRTTVGQRSNGDYVDVDARTLRLLDNENHIVHKWQNGLPRTGFTFGDGPVVSDDDWVAYAFPKGLRRNGVVGDDFRLLVTRLEASSDELEWQDLGIRKGQQVAGWRHEAVLVREPENDETSRYVQVDPDTGQRTVLSTGWPGWMSVAQDIAEQAPIVAGVKPGRAGEPTDPSSQKVAAAGGALGALLVVGAGVVVWRRRVHP